MSVRSSLLAILDQGACYGYQLRAEFDRRTGGTWPLNVGQIYNTLDRLERDGLVTKSAPDAQGHVYYAITDAGSGEVAAWLTAPIERSSAPRDELAIKLAVAASLPGTDVAALVRAQRIASRAHRDALVAEAARDAGDFARAVVHDGLIAHADAELRWLDAVEERLSRHPVSATAVGLSDERPKRGRPVRASAA
jgi:DNA-binding PadR family transcriptional regulator